MSNISDLAGYLRYIWTKTRLCNRKLCTGKSGSYYILQVSRNLTIVTRITKSHLPRDDFVRAEGLNIEQQNGVKICHTKKCFKRCAHTAALFRQTAPNARVPPYRIVNSRWSVAKTLFLDPHGEQLGGGGVYGVGFGGPIKQELEDFTASRLC